MEPSFLLTDLIIQRSLQMPSMAYTSNEGKNQRPTSKAQGCSDTCGRVESEMQCILNKLYCTSSCSTKDTWAILILDELARQLAYLL